MENLLSTKQIQELLNIDRTTVYRMLKDGRLTGMKVGNRWRFPREEIEALLSGETQPGHTESRPEPGQTHIIETVPLGCMQAIQDIFAEIVDVGVVITSIDGEPITNISNSCRFCEQILSSSSGRQGCIASWRKLAQSSSQRPHFDTCHAGLNYACAPIEINDDFYAQLVVGQFYLEPPNRSEAAVRCQQLAQQHNLDADTLAAAAGTVTVLDKHTRANIRDWVAKEAQTIEQIGHERMKLIKRLQSIASISNLELKQSP